MEEKTFLFPAVRWIIPAVPRPQRNITRQRKCLKEALFLLQTMSFFRFFCRSSFLPVFSFSDHQYLYHHHDPPQPPSIIMVITNIATNTISLLIMIIIHHHHHGARMCKFVMGSVTPAGDMSALPAGGSSVRLILHTATGRSQSRKVKVIMTPPKKVKRVSYWVGHQIPPDTKLSQTLVFFLCHLIFVSSHSHTIHTNGGPTVAVVGTQVAMITRHFHNPQ